MSTTATGVDNRYLWMIGKKFGRLTVVRQYTDKANRKTRLECVCDCGKVTHPLVYNVRDGISLSCGCLSRDKGHKTRGCHGLSNTRLYRIWSGARGRCTNKHLVTYQYYGARGISMCEEWRTNFLAFKKWAEESGYDDVLELDRINNNAGYSPENCKWSTRKEQVVNRRCTLFVEIEKKKITLSDACRQTGTRYGKALYRIKHGMTGSSIFT